MVEKKEGKENKKCSTMPNVLIKGYKRHSDIESTLMSYKGRENVKVVCMDLSSGYRSIVRRCFPRAKIVADRFHVIRLVLYHFMEF